MEVVMIRKAALGLALVLLFSVAAAAQLPEGYLDVFIVKVKPDKRAELEAVAKKVAEANRRQKGDTWVALGTEYGEGGTIRFVSVRSSYAEIEKASGAFMGALNKAYGAEGTRKLFQEFDSYIVSSRAEIRRRRWDLSTNVPLDAAAGNKLVGEARWVRTIEVHVRPGQALTFEEQVRAVKTAAERITPDSTTYVSQSVAGTKGTVYYISWFGKSLGDFDGIKPLPELLGKEGYERFLKASSESVASSEVTISRFLPELSNPPEAIASVDPKFWNPKPAAAKPAAAPKQPAKKSSK
jgi:hypothetical protein